MKKYIYFLIIVLAYNIAPAIEHGQKLVCVESSCKQVEIFNQLPNKELSLDDLSEGICLVDLKTSIFSKVIEFDKKSYKIITLKESQDYILNREIFFYNSKKFNRNQKIIPCNQVNGVIGNDKEYNKCTFGNRKKLFKIYCERENVFN